MSIKQEFLDDVMGECEPLLQQHWEEIALNKDHIKLNPDWDSYKELEGIGSLKIFTARDAETDELVGYFAVIVERSLHYKDHLFAKNDVVFLKKEYRKGFTGIRLIKFAEKCLKEDGISILIINSKVHMSFAPVLDRIGYKTVETIHTKYIGS